MKRIHLRNIALALIIACLPVLFIGTVIYYVNTYQIKNTLQEDHKKKLKYSVERMKKYFTDLEDYASLLALQSHFNDKLLNTNFHIDFPYTRELTKSMILLGRGNPLIENISIYLQPSNTYIDSNLGVNKLTARSDIMYFQNLFSNEKDMFWNIQKHTADNISKGSPLSLVIKLKTNTMEPFGTIHIDVAQSSLDSLILNSSSSIGSSWLMSTDGILIAYGKDGTSPSDYMQLIHALNENILAANPLTGSFIYTWNHTQYSVNFNKQARLSSEWIYVSAVPLSQITAPLSAISNSILLIAGMGLLAAIILSIFVSQQMNQPIRRLIALFNDEKTANIGDFIDEIDYIEEQWTRLKNTKDDLQKRVGQSMNILKEGFFIQFLQGQLCFLHEEELQDRLHQFGIESPNKRIVVLMIQLTGMQNFEHKYTKNDEQLLSYAAANIIEEISSSKLNDFHVINLHDSTVGMMVWFNSDTSTTFLYNELHQLATLWIDVIRNILKLKCSVVIGLATNQLSQVPDAFNHARQASHYRNFTKNDEIIDLREFEPQHANHTFDYPFELESEILQSFIFGMKDEANQLMQQFIDYIKKNNGTKITLKQAVMNLLASIHQTMMKRGHNPQQIYANHDLYEELYHVKDPDELIPWFQQHVFLPYSTQLNHDNKLHLKQVVRRIIANMKTEYMSDISLEMYSDQNQLKPYTLSKAFKEETSINFMEFLTQLRLEKTEELLLTTDMKIQDIAEIVRYQPSYLIRQFRKHTGMTPGQYREHHSKNSNN